MKFGDKCVQVRNVCHRIIYLLFSDVKGYIQLIKGFGSAAEIFSINGLMVWFMFVRLEVPQFPSLVFCGTTLSPHFHLVSILGSISAILLTESDLEFSIWFGDTQ